MKIKIFFLRKILACMSKTKEAVGKGVIGPITLFYVAIMSIAFTITWGFFIALLP